MVDESLHGAPGGLGSLTPRVLLCLCHSVSGRYLSQMARANTTPANASMVIQAMADRIVCRFQLEMVVLFGSYARNEATADSDVDLLVVMPVGSYKRELRRQIYRALDDRVLPLDVIVVTPEQVARQRSQVGTIVYPALRDGRVLYQRPQ